MMFVFCSVAQQLETKKMMFEFYSVAQELGMKKMMFGFCSVAQQLKMRLKLALLTDSDRFYPSVITCLKPAFTDH